MILLMLTSRDPVRQFSCWLIVTLLLTSLTGFAQEVEDGLDPIDPIGSERGTLPQIKRKKESIDPRFHPENQFIEHPNAKKGLIKIDKDRVYHYRVNPSDQKYASTFKIGVYEPTNLTSPENENLSFENLYEDTSFPLLLYDQERLWGDKFGQLYWKFGAGFYFARGHGEFVEETPAGAAVEPKEKFTLFVFPLNVGATYRFKYSSFQWLVPYVEGGVDAFCFAERRDDDNNPPAGAALGIAPAAHFSAGGSISLGKNARSFLDLDREYGINALYITGEFRNYVTLSSTYDFSGTVFSAGITAEY